MSAISARYFAISEFCIEIDAVGTHPIIALRSSGHLPAAFLIAWSAAEALLRRTAFRNGLDTAGYGPAALYKELYSIGVIPRKAYEVFAAAIQARNTLVHGFKSPKTELRDKIDSLMDTVDRLLRELNSGRG